jgi:hypothetical protein
VTELLLAAQLARGRHHPDEEYRWIERARTADSESPWPALALVHHLVTTNDGSPAIDRDRTIVQLQSEARTIPGSQLFERAIALRAGRGEDAERILEQLMAAHPNDSRVLRLWVREAVRRGWVREAEDGLAKLEADLPGSLAVTDLRLEVLASLERWRERGTLLRALATATPVETRWIGEMASSCLVGDAVSATASLAPNVVDPDLDVQLVTLLLESGDIGSARRELERARGQWGELRIFDELGLFPYGRPRTGPVESSASGLGLARRS